MNTCSSVLLHKWHCWQTVQSQLFNCSHIRKYQCYLPQHSLACNLYLPVRKVAWCVAWLYGQPVLGIVDSSEWGSWLGPLTVQNTDKQYCGIQISTLTLTLRLADQHLAWLFNIPISPNTPTMDQDLPCNYLLLHQISRQAHPIPFPSLQCNFKGCIIILWIHFRHWTCGSEHSLLTVTYQDLAVKALHWKNEQVSV